MLPQVIKFPAVLPNILLFIGTLLCRLWTLWTKPHKEKKIKTKKQKQQQQNMSGISTSKGFCKVWQTVLTEWNQSVFSVMKRTRDVVVMVTCVRVRACVCVCVLDFDWTCSCVRILWIKTKKAQDTVYIRLYSRAHIFIKLALTTRNLSGLW